MWLYLYLVLDIHVWSFICIYLVLQHTSKILNNLPEYKYHYVIKIEGIKFRGMIHVRNAVFLREEKDVHSLRRKFIWNFFKC